MSLAVALPEVGGQRRHARVQDIRVLEGLVAVVVLRVHTQNRRLDAQVDVLGDERDAGVRVLVLQRSVCARIALSAP